MYKTYVLGGGTFEPISNHLSLSAPAFGKVASDIYHKMSQIEVNSERVFDPILALTKMADSKSNIVTNTDVSNFIDEIINDNEVKCIVFSIAMCDFKYDNGNLHGDRLSSSESMQIKIDPTEKIIDKIRRSRPDIFLIGFKTTTNKTIEEQFLVGLKMMKRSKCNLVLCNDVITRKNFIITPEETIYGTTTSRDEIVNMLVDITSKRITGTYQKTNFVQSKHIVAIDNIPFNKIIQYLIDNGGFIENNGNGFTPGHFCCRINNEETISDIVNEINKDYKDVSLNDVDLVFASSMRKVDHNKVFEEGMTFVVVLKNGEIYSFGKGKPSVGARSQFFLLKNNPEYDYIIHTHNPKTSYSILTSAEQYPYQCGSNECGLNTLGGLKDYENGDIKAVYLEKHGANILFKLDKENSIDTVIRFIDENIKLGEKVI